jgi:isocitrate/isopropylmalate dehydrogenase
LGAGLVGGLGVAPGMNIGEEGALFEAIHAARPTLPVKIKPIAGHAPVGVEMLKFWTSKLKPKKLCCR